MFVKHKYLIHQNKFGELILKISFNIKDKLIFINERSLKDTPGTPLITADIFYQYINRMKINSFRGKHLYTCKKKR